MYLDALPEGQQEVAADPLPRMRPLDGPWVTVDAAYGGQIAERARLLAERRTDVLYESAGSAPARAELVALVRETLAADPRFGLRDGAIATPDGRQVRPETFADLGTVLAEDLVLIEKVGGAHVLSAAILCFPASWTLAQKAGKPLGPIHAPVKSYDAAIAARVDRLFDGVQPGRPLWRANCHAYDAPDLYAPRREHDPRPLGGPDAPWWRSERQTVLRLPETRAVLFAIHTSVAPRTAG